MKLLSCTIAIIFGQAHGQVHFPTPAPSPTPSDPFPTPPPSPTPFHPFPTPAPSPSPSNPFPTPVPSPSPSSSAWPSLSPTFIDGTLPPTAEQFLKPGCALNHHLPRHCPPISISPAWSVQQRALAALYASTLGCEWNNATGWLSFILDECTWFGVECNQNHDVVKIDLAWNNLQCQIPSELANLASLQVLELGLNKLTGTIPTELANLKFDRLHLHFNHLIGPIPPDLTINSSLLLQDNFFTSTIPSEMAGTTPLLLLDHLTLSSNCLTGTIPSVDASRELGVVASGKDGIVQRFHSNELVGSLAAVCDSSRRNRLAELTADCNRVICDCCTECFDPPDHRRSPFSCDDPLLYVSSGSRELAPPSSDTSYGNGLYVPAGFNGTFLYRNPLLPNSVNEIAIDPSTNRAFAQHGDPVFELFEIDLKTGREIDGSRFSTVPVNQFHGMEYVQDTLYGAGWVHEAGAALSGSSSLYIIHPDSRTWTLIGPTGVHPITGLAWTGKQMYASAGAAQAPFQLYTIDLQTGAATIVCPDTRARFGSLVYDWTVSKLVGGRADGRLSEINPETCEVTEVSRLGLWPITGLSFGCYNAINNCRSEPPTDSPAPTDPPTESPAPTPSPSTTPTDRYPSPSPTDSPQPTPSPSSDPTVSRSPTPKPTFGAPTASPFPTGPSAAPTDSPVPTMTPPPSSSPASQYCPLAKDNCMLDLDQGIDGDSSTLQRQALVQLYRATVGCQWNNATGWLEPQSHECSWFGIRCNDANKVTQINLDWNNLQCQIPSELAHLTSLQVLELSLNKLTGTIPTELGNLVIPSFHLHFNHLTGQIPQNLHVNSGLLLQDNRLAGHIPSELGILFLDQLTLSSNCLTGSIPFDREDNVASTRIQRYHSNQLSGANELCSPRHDWNDELTSDCQEVSCACCTQCYVDVPSFPCTDPVLYVASGSRELAPPSSDNLFGSGLYVPVGFEGGFLYRNPLLPSSIHEIAINPENNRAIVQHGDPAFELFEVDLKTGREISGSRFSTDPVNQFPGMEYIDGTLFGAGWVHSPGATSTTADSILYIIDPDSKSWTVVGETGVSGISGLAWTGSELYAVSGNGLGLLYRINVQNGAGTIVCPATGALFESLVYDWSVSKLYAGRADGRLSEINPVTCEVADVYKFGNWPVAGMSMGCYNARCAGESPTPAPTDSSAPTERLPTHPTPLPSEAPTDFPTSSPTVSPTGFPTSAPTYYPTAPPSVSFKPSFFRKPVVDKTELTIIIEQYTSSNLNDIQRVVSIYGEIRTWDVSRLTDMSGIFQNKVTFNEDISGWDVSSVVDMSFMFQSAHSFNADISRWDVSSVTTMKFMFRDAFSFTGGSSNARRLGDSSTDSLDMSDWDVSSVTDMSGMFWGANAFNADISQWNISSLTKANSMFRKATSFNHDLCGWGPALKKNRASVPLMFLDSGCPRSFTPNLEITTPNPLCRCCIGFCVPCFSGQASVETTNNRTLLMKDVKIGDYVKVDQDKFERVYAFGHYEQDTLQEFMVFNHELVASSEHMIASYGRGFVPAGTMKVGDMLVAQDGTAVRIDSITRQASSGMFAPFTPSGMLLVNGYVVSSFISMQGDSGKLKVGAYSTGLSFQWLAHTFEFPHRLACFYFGQCPNETYGETGISFWVEKPLELTAWWLKQSAPVVLIILIPLSLILGVFAVGELLLTSYLPWLLLLVVSGVIRNDGRRKKNCMPTHLEEKPKTE